VIIVVMIIVDNGGNHCCILVFDGTWWRGAGHKKKLCQLDAQVIQCWEGSGVVWSSGLRGVAGCNDSGSCSHEVNGVLVGGRGQGTIQLNKKKKIGVKVIPLL